MRIYEITQENEVLAKLRNIKFEFSEYRKLLQGLLESISSPWMSIALTNSRIRQEISKHLDDFENQVDSLIQDDSFDIEGDSDLANHIRNATEDLRVIKEMRREIGI